MVNRCRETEKVVSLLLPSLMMRKLWLSAISGWINGTKTRFFSSLELCNRALCLFRTFFSSPGWCLVRQHQATTVVVNLAKKEVERCCENSVRTSCVVGNRHLHHNTTLQEIAAEASEPLKCSASFWSWLVTLIAEWLEFTVYPKCLIWILAFCTKFCLIRITYLVTLFDQ